MTTIINVWLHKNIGNKEDKLGLDPNVHCWIRIQSGLFRPGWTRLFLLQDGGRGEFIVTAAGSSWVIVL